MNSFRVDDGASRIAEPCLFCGSHNTGLLMEKNGGTFRGTCVDCDATGPSSDDANEALRFWDKAWVNVMGSARPWPSRDIKVSYGTPPWASDIKRLIERATEKLEASFERERKQAMEEQLKQLLKAKDRVEETAWRRSNAEADHGRAEDNYAAARANFLEHVDEGDQVFYATDSSGKLRIITVSEQGEVNVREETPINVSRW